MDGLDGRWKVRRESGLLPPFGVRKFVAGEHGWTLFAFLPLAPFSVQGAELRYRFWPIRDELHQLDDGTFVGEGRIFGRRFCRFRLEPVQGTVPRRPRPRLPRPRAAAHR